MKSKRKRRMTPASKLKLSKQLRVEQLQKRASAGLPLFEDSEQFYAFRKRNTLFHTCHYHQHRNGRTPWYDDTSNHSDNIVRALEDAISGQFNEA